MDTDEDTDGNADTENTDTDGAETAHDDDDAESVEEKSDKKSKEASESSDTSYAILNVISTTLVVHCMLWPSLGLIIGVTILFINVCDNSANSPRSSPFNSLERPWLRYADRNYEKVGTLAENYNS